MLIKIVLILLDQRSQYPTLSVWLMYQQHDIVHTPYVIRHLYGSRIVEKTLKSNFQSVSFELYCIFEVLYVVYDDSNAASECNRKMYLSDGIDTRIKVTEYSS